MKDLHYASLAQLCPRLKSGELAATAVTEHMLGRIDALNPHLHAYCRVLADDALATAAELDAKRAAGEPLGALHGVPIALKDLLNTQGIATASGTTVMADYVPGHDATVVARLRAAGAIVLGKVQLTEGAYGSHHPDITAPVNPWDERLWPGVSSSGSGVSVAAGMAFAALGSDTGGSIRFPSAANGVVGIKPTYGRVSRYGAFPLAESLDHIGPLARSVGDAARILGAIAGYDVKDPNSLSESVPNYAAELDAGIGDMTFGVDWAYVEGGVHAECAVTVRDAVERLRDLGATVREVSLPPDHAALVKHWVITCAVECALAHEGMYPEHKERYGPDLAQLIELGRKCGAMQYGALERIRERFRRELNDMFDGSGQAASSGADSNGLDGLLCPVLPTAVPTLDDMGRRLREADDTAEFLTFTAPFDYSGHPTLTLPVGLDAERRPRSVQIVGRLLGEASLIRAGAALEASYDFTERPLD